MGNIERSVRVAYATLTLIPVLWRAISVWGIHSTDPSDTLDFLWKHYPKEMRRYRKIIEGKR